MRKARQSRVNNVYSGGMAALKNWLALEGAALTGERLPLPGLANS